MPTKCDDIDLDSGVVLSRALALWVLARHPFTTQYRYPLGSQSKALFEENSDNFFFSFIVFSHLVIISVFVYLFIACFLNRSTFMRAEVISVLFPLGVVSI